MSQEDRNEVIEKAIEDIPETEDEEEEKEVPETQSQWNKQPSLEMKKNILQYTDLCAQLKTIRADTKVLNDRRKELEALIRDYMITQDVPLFTTRDAQFTLCSSKKIQPLNKEFLRTTIQTRIADPKIAEELTALAFDNRPVHEERKIKHTPLKK